VLTNVELEQAVMNVLKEAPTVEHGHIGVTAQDGVVWLRGTVPTSAVQWEAERVAALVRGVKRVVNHLEVVPGRAVEAAVK